MAFAIKDRVAETTVTTGTGTVTLLGAQLGFQSFSAIGNANTTMYLILSGNGTDWETGIGTYTSSGTTLTRTTILSSSNGGSAISLVGTSLVMCSMNSHITDANGLFNQLFSSPANGNYSLTVTGGVWTVTAAGAGASGSGLFSTAMHSTPTKASTGFGTTWLSQSGIVATDETSGVSLRGTNATNLTITYKTAPAAPYRCSALIGLANNATTGAPFGGNRGYGLCFTDGTKIHTVRSQYGAPMQLIVDKWNTTNSFSANDFAPGGEATYWLGSLIWLQLRRDGSNNIYFNWSSDGINWHTLFTTTTTAGFLGAAGYTNVGFLLRGDSTAMGAVMLDYSETA